MKRKPIDWTRKDADIARDTGLCRWRVGQMRVEETGITARGVRYDPPKGFKPGKYMLDTMRKYNVRQHVAKWWFKCAGITPAKAGRPPKTAPAGFAPVLCRKAPINYRATAKKYGTTVYLAKVWSNQATAKP